MDLIITTPSAFENKAKNELVSLFKDGFENSFQTTFFKGVIIGRVDIDMEGLKKVFNARDTEFINKVYPVERVDSWEKSDLIEFLEKKNGEGFDIKGRHFVVRCHRRGTHKFSSVDLERDLGAYLYELGGIVDLTNPEIIISVQILQDEVFMGVLEKDDIILKVPKKTKKWKKGERPLSRAEMKMREILRRFPKIFQGDRVVLDVGAAPGGWSSAMAKMVRKVIAVDPGEMDTSVLELPNVEHRKIRAENLELDFDVDVLTNDSNLVPGQSASMSVMLGEKYLKAGGYLLHTVKFGMDPNSGEFPAKDLNHACDEVIEEFRKGGMKIINVTRLEYNTRNELTIIGRKD